jgi:hypothetical protein
LEKLKKVPKNLSMLGKIEGSSEKIGMLEKSFKFLNYKKSS